MNMNTTSVKEHSEHDLKTIRLNANAFNTYLNLDELLYIKA
jgi:hypothetical protein